MPRGYLCVSFNVFKFIPGSSCLKLMTMTLLVNFQTYCLQKILLFSDEKLRKAVAVQKLLIFS